MYWKIDNAHSRIAFRVRYMMISTVRGEFKKFTGTIDFNQERPEETLVEVRIDAASIDTGAPDRDTHLRSPDFLDVEEHPVITFNGTHVELVDDEHATLMGDLTIRGVTHPAELDVTFNGMARSPWGAVSAGFSAETTLNRKDWGLTWNKALETGGFLVGDKLDVEIELELIKSDVEEAEEDVQEAVEVACR
jgi:polyisoprenoid-binding protein YceI